MTEATEAPGPIDETSKSTTIRARNGANVRLERDVNNGLHYLTVLPRDARGGNTGSTAIVTDEDIRALLVGREKCCANCAHARQGSGGGTRCHERLRANRGGVYAPLIHSPREHVCGKHEQLVPVQARQVAA